MPKLTTSYVNGLQATGRRYTVTDDSLPGYEIRVGITGAKTAAIRYRHGRRIERLTLGRIGEHFSPAKARRLARMRLGEVADGRNPARERRERADAASFAEVAARFMEEHARPYLKPSTADKYAAMLESHLLPALGKVAVAEVTRADAERLHQRIGKRTPGQANRVLALLSSIMSKAEDWGLRPQRSNPCYKLPKFRERKIQRYLSAEERGRLEAALVESERAQPGQPTYVTPGAVDALRLLSLTGARCGEIVGLTWAMVDLERARLHLPDSKTGQKVIPLSRQAVAFLSLLEQRRRRSEGWVCPNECGGKLGNIERAWRSIRRRAEIEDVRIHDLRHSFVSDAVGAGIPLAVVRHMAGHKSVATTDRYAHLEWAAVQAGTDAAGERIERRTREGAERLRQQAVGDEQGEAEARSEGAEVVPIGGKVLRFPGPRRR